MKRDGTYITEEEETFEQPAPIPDFIQLPNCVDINLMDLRPHEIARQLTILDHELLTQITKQQMLDYAVHQTNSPSIVKVTDRFNYLVLWVSTEIVLSLTIEKRIETIFKFVNIALVNILF